MVSSRASWPQNVPALVIFKPFHISLPHAQFCRGAVRQTDRPQVFEAWKEHTCWEPLLAPKVSILSASLSASTPPDTSF